MTPAGVVEMGTSPSGLALNTAGTHLYSTNRTNRIGDDKLGSVSALAVNRADVREYVKHLASVPRALHNALDIGAYEF